MNGAKDTTKSGPAPATTTTTTVPAVTISKSPAAVADAVYAAAAPSNAHSTTVPLMAGANGNDTNSASAAAASAAINKKRKKDGLKPIITTEGPAPVPFPMFTRLASLCAGSVVRGSQGLVRSAVSAPKTRYQQRPDNPPFPGQPSRNWRGRVATPDEISLMNRQDRSSLLSQARKR
ncbi:hypothetical protein FHL15_002694 [Xylaria flabelliformis]|uniref:Uncharacterized protein n=1 Tax=Xylaria flabelliformis TaxID=2512241 RepID=A0A553I898_9PEZI|nr:hypothetical protein FHL15_002694 [Xylaria flabelliformis]